MRSRITLLAALTILLTLTVHAAGGGKRALLIGINDYTASTLRTAASRPTPERDWPNLSGTINDVHLMRDVIESMYGFKRDDIVMLTDQHATHDAILRELKRLVASARKDDVVLFYYSGHGSQVRNSLSAEKDKLDESIVPADSRLGADDVRDKQLRDAFNAILDRGAKLTVVLDTCHSGSGARGLDSGLRAKIVKPDVRDVADPSTGPRPEDRGGLILSATQDFDEAFETSDPQGVIRGAFTWALTRALADAERGEPMSDTFQRLQARLSVDRPGQDPVLAGTPAVRLRPFLGERADRKNRRPVIAIQEIGRDGTYKLQGGWANGVTAGSELRVASDRNIRLEVKEVTGISSSVARVVSPSARAASQLGPGTLLEIDAWAPPPARPLRIWMPRCDDASAFALKLREEAAAKKIVWVDDPTQAIVTHVIRWRDGGWEIVEDGRVQRTTTPLDSIAPGSSVFVQLPVPAKLAAEIGDIDGIELTPGPELADYILAGRLSAKGVEYAFVRPQVSAGDVARAALPVRTAWSRPESSFALQDALMRLQRIHGWYELTPPIGTTTYYTLGIRRADDHVLVEDGVLLGGRPHHLVLRAKPDSLSDIHTRFVYAFVIDSAGTSTLLFPRANSGSVENRLPLTRQASKAVRSAEAEIPLDESEPFNISAPYGADTYFLLSTSAPLPALGSLEWSGVRGDNGRRRGPSGEAVPQTPLERLLARTLSGKRGDGDDPPIPTSFEWSLQKVTFRSVPPRRTQP